MCKVIIEGFISEKQAKTFIEWFEGQGEQDADIWFEENDVPSPYVDCVKTYPLKKDQDGNFTMIVK